MFHHSRSFSADDPHGQEFVPPPAIGRGHRHLFDQAMEAQTPDSVKRGSKYGTSPPGSATGDSLPKDDHFSPMSRSKAADATGFLDLAVRKVLTSWIAAHAPPATPKPAASVVSTGKKGKDKAPPLGGSAQTVPLHTGAVLHFDVVRGRRSGDKKPSEALFLVELVRGPPHVGHAAENGAGSRAHGPFGNGPQRSGGGTHAGPVLLPMIPKSPRSSATLPREPVLESFETSFILVDSNLHIDGEAAGSSGTHDSTEMGFRTLSVELGAPLWWHNQKVSDSDNLEDLSLDRMEWLRGTADLVLSRLKPTLSPDLRQRVRRLGTPFPGAVLLHGAQAR